MAANVPLCRKSYIWLLFQPRLLTFKDKLECTPKRLKNFRFAGSKLQSYFSVIKCTKIYAGVITVFG